MKKFFLLFVGVLLTPLMFIALVLHWICVAINLIIEKFVDWVDIHITNNLL